MDLFTYSVKSLSEHSSSSLWILVSFFHSCVYYQALAIKISRAVQHSLLNPACPRQQRSYETYRMPFRLHWQQDQIGTEVGTTPSRGWPLWSWKRTPQAPLAYQLCFAYVLLHNVCTSCYIVSHHIYKASVTKPDQFKCPGHQAFSWNAALPYELIPKTTIILPVWLVLVTASNAPWHVDGHACR